MKDNGLMSLDKESKKEACKEHHLNLLNVKFPLNPSDLFKMGGMSEPITIGLVEKAIIKMSFGKAAGPSGIVAEMLESSSPDGPDMIRDLIENIISVYRLSGKKVT